MGTIASPVKEIEGINVRPIPPTGKPLKNVEAVVREGREIIVVDKHGNIYSNSYEKPYYYMFGDKGAEVFVKLLAKIGRITKAQADEHVRLSQERRAARDKRHDAAQVLDHAAKLGLKLTKAQYVKLATLADRKED